MLTKYDLFFIDSIFIESYNKLDIKKQYSYPQGVVNLILILTKIVTKIKCKIITCKKCFIGKLMTTEDKEKGNRV